MDEIDIALIQDSDGQFDIGIDPDTGDLLLVKGFETALTMSIFEERRADKSEVANSELRRGWWGNTVGPEGFEIGSKLWLLDQARKIQATLNSANDYTKLATQWLVIDKHLVSVDTEVRFTANGMDLDVKLKRSNGKTEIKSYQLWENTEAVNV
jgi:phage gp46-like protein